MGFTVLMGLWEVGLSAWFEGHLKWANVRKSWSACPGFGNEAIQNFLLQGLDGFKGVLLQAFGHSARNGAGQSQIV